MEESTFLPDISFSRTINNSSRPHTQSKKIGTGKKRHNVVVFPYYRDHLACDPQNSFCVYGNYEFRWGDPIAEAEENIYSLIDDMIVAAQRAFDEAQVFWKKLPSSVQRAHILRNVNTLTSASVSPTPHFNASPLQHTPTHTHTDAATFTALLRHTKRKSVDLSISHIAVNTSAATTVNINANTSAVLAGSRGGGAGGSVSVRPTTAIARVLRREEEEEAIVRELTPQWIPPMNHTKCRIVLDIVASRKTLGDSPHSSEPYRLGQMAFKYAYTKYAAEVMTMFVGISDSAVTLVGRDILYPYRVTGGGGGGAGITGAAGGGAKTLVSPEPPNISGPSRAAGTRGAGNTRAEAAAMAAALSYAGAMNTTMSISSAAPIAMAPNLEQLLPNTIPAPRMVMAPPVNTEKVDNVRLVVCFPLVDTELDDVL
ncbi:uncharacterized protein TM35_000012450 [Trypanosoma theileri]|uniref:Uncharacterized protein n=1 Tax=Trypanosoma theileri TaxID=67003 RepID=A0A1X0P912_9TRYP|nr:uncharacterized protein TM35_000012450 [Trypanosoma theileri]ORC93368.1 hypothetical protein TM35_000012450 [Trypanosoma theileri]